MKKNAVIFAIFAAMIFPAASEVLPFDSNWRFFKGDAPGAEVPNFNAADWQAVRVPHDWAIAGPFNKDNPAGGAGAFLPAGAGWYRKEFTPAQSINGRRLYIEFDGVMANSDVWINGHLLGHRPNGYASFCYDMTPYLRGAGQRNVLAVRADDAPQPASRWYAGAGIYRHTHLMVFDPVHIEPWSEFITTPQVTATQALVRARATVTNQSDSPRDVSLTLHVAGQTAASKPQTVPPGGSADFSVDVRLPDPRRWDIAGPFVYSAALAIDGANADADNVRFGIREFRFDPATGFWLNGRNFKLHGVCLHGDGSCFGTAVPMSVWRRRLSALRELGANAIRTAHNPPDPAFLDLCDAMGFLVMDEFFDCWTVGKNKYDYHLYFNDWSKIDARGAIRRDRNHPSIILYSVGNEIHDTPKAALAKGILAALVEVCHQNDPTRPATQALFRPNVSGDFTNGLADLLDVIGVNYRDNELIAAHRAKPSRKIIGTEQRQDRATWLECRDHPQEAGQFLWTGVDYLGESRRWPIVAAGSGLLDRCGQPRPMAFQRQSWWSDKPMVFAARRLSAERTEAGDPGFAPLDRSQTLFADWTPRDLSPHEETVEVYSNCKKVELFLNGHSMGARPMPEDASPLEWKVPFEPGTLEAAGFNEGMAAAQHTLRTAGPPAKIRLAAGDAIHPGWESAASVRAEVEDANGVRAPSATNLITFAVEGPAAIVAVDSADNASHEPFQSHQRRAFQGECFAMIEALLKSGSIRVTASAPGLPEASLILMAQPEAP
ncbi:MAG TPA: glycoside hydrolase family 2 TIM barrel-domain containing protein [Verrucomicrobiae bacterium]